MRQLNGNPLGGPAWNVVSERDEFDDALHASSLSMFGHRGNCLAWQSHASSLSTFGHRGNCLAWQSHASSLGTFGRRGNCLVWQPNASSLGTFGRRGKSLAAGWLVKRAARRPAQPAAVADAALRPRDRAFFEGWDRTSVVPVYRCGAAKRQPVRRPGNVVATPFLDGDRANRAS